MKIFVTRYALSEGTIECEAWTKSNMGKHDVFTRFKAGGPELYFQGFEYRLTLEEAMERAESMRVKKIKANNRQNKKLKELIIKHVVVDRMNDGSDRP